MNNAKIKTAIALICFVAYIGAVVWAAWMKNVLALIVAIAPLVGVLFWFPGKEFYKYFSEE